MTSTLCCLNTGALATTESQPTTDGAPALTEVHISATPGPGHSISHRLQSVDILGPEHMADKAVAQSWELLGQMPGVQLTETRMGAESGKPTFRAFNGEGYINGIKVLIDGIPSNVNSGNQRFIDMVFPLELDYIEVVRGTQDPRYGLHNIGGNIHLGTRQGGNYNESRWTYGSDATREVQWAWGRESDGLAQNYVVARQDTHGYRSHSASEKFTLAGKWFVTSPDGSVKAGVVARLYSHDAQEPGFLTAAQWRQNPRQSGPHNANDGDQRTMRHLSAHVDWHVTPQLFAASKLYFNGYQDERRVTFTDNASPSLNNLPRQKRVWDERQLGWMGTLNWQAASRVMVESGLNVEQQKNVYQRYRYAFASPTDFSQAVTTSNDDLYTLNNVGAYAQAHIQASERLQIVPGLRLDQFSGDTLIRTSGVRGALQDSGLIQQPKLSMSFSLNSATRLYANWGRSFQILTGSRAPAYITSATQSRFAPSINTGAEIGLQLKPNAHTDWRLSLWRQEATNEVANMPSTGTTVGLGQTLRRGLDLQGSGRWGRQLQWTASQTWQEARVVSAYTASGQSLAGKEVFSTPRRISLLGLDYLTESRVKLGLQGRYQGSYFIDDLNAQGKFGATLTWDASVKVPVTPQATLDLQMKNLANRRQAYVWYDNFFWPAGQAQPMYSPAAGRAIFVSLHLKL